MEYTQNILRIPQFTWYSPMGRRARGSRHTTSSSILATTITIFLSLLSIRNVSHRAAITRPSSPVSHARASGNMASAPTFALSRGSNDLEDDLKELIARSARKEDSLRVVGLHL